MATLIKKQKLAVLNRENSQEKSRINLAQNTSVTNLQDVYITHVFEEIEGIITRKPSKEFSWTESRILDALTRLVYKKEYDTSRAGRTSSDTNPFQHSLRHCYNITNHKVFIYTITNNLKNK